MLKTSRANPAKIAPPRLAEVYRRERLFKLLDKARERPVVWISAPAGAGKTTLVMSYLKERKLSPLWYQVDEGDGDVASFFYYLRLAAQNTAPRRKPLPLLTPEYLAGLPVFTRNFFRDLYPCLRRPGVLVLDNYQDVASDVPLQELLPVGLGEIPEGMNVIVLSRVDPPASFTRLVTNSHIACLDWNALQLTEDESRGIAKLRQGDGDAADTLTTNLFQQSQGWVAGLVLLLEQARTSSGAIMPSQINDLSKVFNYFASEIFQRTDLSVQNFLLYTAFLPKITLAHAEQLTGNRDTARILQDLTQRNYFTVRHTEGSYEYHPLFRSFLLNQAGKRHTQEHIRQIQQKSAQVLVDGGDVETAVSLLQQAQDWPALIPLILNQARALIGQGRAQTLAGWLQALPDTLREENPWLLYWFGVCRLPYSQPEARSYFEKAFGLFESGADADPLYLAWTGIIDSFIIEWHDFRPIAKWLDIYPALRGTRKPPSPDIEAASIFSFVTGLIYHRPDDPSFEEYAHRAEALFEREVERWFMQGASLIYCYLWVRQLGKANRLLQALAPYSTRQDVEPPARILWYSLKSLHAFMALSSEQCVEAASEGLRLAKETGVHQFDAMLSGHYVMGQLHLGHVTAARELIDQMLPRIGSASTANSFFMYSAASVSLHERDLARALKEVDESLRYDSINGVPFSKGMDLLGRAFVLGKMGDFDQAAQEIESARAINARVSSPILSNFSALAEANILWWSGKQEQAMPALREAISFASQDGRIGLPSWQCRDDAALLYSMALDAGIQTDFVRTMIAKIRLPAPTQSVSENWPFSVKIHTLGRFSLLLDDKPLKFSGKTQKKPLELLKALIAFGGRDVREDRLTQALWPDADGDSATLALNTTLHRLRKLLGEEAIERQEGRLTLSSRYCWVDVWAFERQLTELEEACLHRRIDRIGGIAERLLSLYRGVFLANEPEYPWVLSMRERLRARMLRQLDAAGRALTEAAQHDRAIHCYGKALEIDSLAESFYRGLMQSYLATGRRAEALTTFERCQNTLRIHLDISPSPETLALARSISAL